MTIIKKEKVMMAREFIVFGLENNIKNLITRPINGEHWENAIIYFNSDGIPVVSENVRKYHMYKIEIEEPITERTNLDTLVEVRENGTVHTHYDTSIREEERDSTIEFHTLIDGKLVLIWDREEGLVE
ncbi:hypothetical protein N7L96_01870 [Mammaliicoccus sciuri]|uniref:hypothetical protein n=1 Tax=Mammaliicoccus sciuri TaxID=1296 RepID=UPI0023424F7C|nr:hypothetical protein [Mammaliicoccus sciuri]MDC5693335.1 hypothetical protein [Mammaliicoccus sciuri]